MAPTTAIILAAGLSTRMKSETSKVLHLLAGHPVVSYPIAAARACGVEKILVVRGPTQKDLRAYLDAHAISGVVQPRPLGTGHAVQIAMHALTKKTGHVLILCGDAPLVRGDRLKAFLAQTIAKRASLGVVTMTLDDPGSYGRIVRDLDGRLVRIVEAKDAGRDELKICEVNSGIYCVESHWLAHALKKLKSTNAKREYYLTDIVGIALKEGLRVEPFHSDPPEDYLGINTRIDFATVAQLMRTRINHHHMLGGVGIQDSSTTWIDSGVTIGVDTAIAPGVFLLGETNIGSGCTIEPGVIVRDGIIADDVHLKAYSVIEGSRIDAGAIVGPFARVRPESHVGRKARIGNFVELKKCDLQEGAKANHLTYLGDAVVGPHSNIGCGTITCNYDGFSKHRTIIGAEVFVGSDVQFVAPVRIGHGALIGAGSTITEDVPAGALALSRLEQRNVKGYVAKRKRLKGTNTTGH